MEESQQIIECILLLALPASGKSEVRRYLAGLDPQECRRDFHLGPTVQLDDFPYVHMMRRIDAELVARGRERIFFHSPARPFCDPRDWGTLIHLINEDHDDLLRENTYQPKSASMHLFHRLDQAANKSGAGPRLGAQGTDLLTALAVALDDEAAGMLQDKHKNHPEKMEGKTLVIEFARGGPEGAPMPLPEPYGYAYSLSQLSASILEKACILYIWVTPEESRRKNVARTDASDPGSILHHGVPEEVMRGDYGCDDMDWLQANTGVPGTVTVAAHRRIFHLPAARFDNRVDKTTFIRRDPCTWRQEEVSAVGQELRAALEKLFAISRHGPAGARID